ncbi:uncharacterized protein LOC18422732 isoform X2 [Amborella trichopoda]|uniref:uncharacterized protein LOC18422732 isoform X2 n=1 Tax=Amborella trichopoda TaxID=13333 RepID=UPI0005D325FC|nr:uncharacterized protein LOC18422732 isoform X2 [Amborella trichopoda]|eukprot:XP_011624468.1 uncharacterized protein LOC18422732 isoform X2 [Amborella trichopoda]
MSEYFHSKSHLIFLRRRSLPALVTMLKRKHLLSFPFSAFLPSSAFSSSSSSSSSSAYSSSFANSSSSSTSSSSFANSSSRCVLRIGDVFRRVRKFGSEDVMEYSRLSHDSNPLHLDAQAAQRAGFDGCLVHGMLVASLFPCIIASHFPGAVYASQNLQFKLPIYVGDEVAAEVCALELRVYKEKAKFSTKCFKKGEFQVIDGEAMAILPSLAVNHVHVD